MLGAIIVSFALFFGYSRINRVRRAVGGLPEGHPVATVNRAPISAAEFKFFFDKNMDSLKTTVKDEASSKSISNFAKMITLQQLIRRNMELKIANDIGISVPDEELASIIKKSVAGMRGEEFDPIFYRHQFLPFFEDRYGINYESLTRQDISIDMLQKLFSNLGAKPPAGGENIMWTFEVAVVEPKKLVEKKVIADESEALKIAEQFISSSNSWEKIANRNKTEIKKVGPITIAERSRILDERATLEELKQIFTLEERNPVIKSPIKRGNKLFVIRLVEKKKSPIEQKEKRTDEFLNDWLQNEIADAKIVNYLGTEE
jgi:hypothetical protein